MRISIEFEGRTIGGHYEVSKRLVTVHADEGGSKSAQLGNTDPQDLAELLLLEIASQRAQQRRE